MIKKRHLSRENVDVAKKGNLKRETESLPIALQNNAIRTNHIKARIDKTQQNSRFRLYGERDDIINHILSECSKLARKEYKTRHDWVSMLIHWELCKKLKFDYTNKWYMYNAESVLVNEIHKLFGNFETQTDHLILARWLDLKIINKKERTCRIVDFAVLGDHKVELKEFEKKDKYFDLVMELKKLWNMKVTIIPIEIGALGTVIKGLVQELEDLDIRWRVETVQTTALLRLTRILRRVRENWGDLLTLKFQWKTIS